MENMVYEEIPDRNSDAVDEHGVYIHVPEEEDLTGKSMESAVQEYDLEIDTTHLTPEEVALALFEEIVVDISPAEKDIIIVLASGKSGIGKSSNWFAFQEAMNSDFNSADFCILRSDRIRGELIRYGYPPRTDVGRDLCWLIERTLATLLVQQNYNFAVDANLDDTRELFYMDIANIGNSVIHKILFSATDGVVSERLAKRRSDCVTD